MSNECIGCGLRVADLSSLHESGEFCARRGECPIKDFAGVNRLRNKTIEGMLYLDMNLHTLAEEINEHVNSTEEPPAPVCPDRD